MELLSQISENVQSGDDKMAREFTKKAIAENITPKKILDDALIGAMNIVGEQFKNHEIFLPDVLLSAKAMTISLDELKPLLSKSENSFSDTLLKKENLAESVKTIIGGAPVSKEYAAEIGADAYGFDGVNAVSKIKALMGV